VYVASPRQPGTGLLHLAVTGSGEGTTVAPAADSPVVPDLPCLAAPRLVTAKGDRLLLAGQTLGGDLLVHVVGERARSQPIPPEVSHGRHPTALEVDRQGVAYVATDGAGVLTYKDGEWGVHPITEHLPILEGSDLKPVDDILVADDGTVYAACQFQVVIWKPDQAQP